MAIRLEPELPYKRENGSLKPVSFWWQNVPAIQLETDTESQTAEIVIMTHFSAEKAMQHALDKLEKLDVVREISNFIRVEEI